MKNQHFDPKFTWTPTLFVTGVTFLLFCKILELLNSSYPKIFLWVGLTALLAGCVAGLVSFSLKPKDHGH
jgi:hypothetical protein